MCLIDLERLFEILEVCLLIMVVKIKWMREKYFFVYNSLFMVSGENNMNEGEIFFCI